ncbi:MAG: TlpA family protein disulfide reductase [Alphaproteobacteria bacterium]
MSARVVFLGLLLASVFAMPVQAAKVEVGDTPPEYLGKDPDGEKIHLSEYRGKVVVVTFWATWCPPCMIELPMLEALQRQAGQERMRVIAINFKQGRKAYHQIIRQLDEFEMIIAYDWKGRVAGRYGVKGLPHMFIINKQGKVADIHLGYSEKAIDPIIDSLNALLLEDYTP